LKAIGIPVELLEETTFLAAEFNFIISSQAFYIYFI
jgi:hypothetical protein